MNSAGFAAAIAAAQMQQQPEDDVIRCYFCGRGRCDVPYLIVQGLSAICSECLGEALQALRESIYRELAPNGPRVAARGRAASVGDGAPGGTASAAGVPLTQVRVPQSGFTGDMCNECGNFRMVRTGTCLTCLDCGSTSGGCS